MGNEKNIKFLSEEFLSNLTDLKLEVEKMNSLFSDIKAKTSDITNYWNGKSSDNNIQSFNNFSSVFDSINENNKKYTDFLDQTYSKYKLLEEKINQTINESSKALSINGSDK